VIDGRARHGRLLAHAEAFPFSCLAPYAPTHLTRRHGILDAPTQRLADAFETSHRAASGASLDAIRHTRDLAWFDDLPNGAHLHAVLFSLARRHLRLDGAHVGLNPAPNLAERARQWRALTFLLPADLLISGLCAAERIDPRTETVDLVTPQLAARLGDGIAETHLHLGASIPFPYVWASFTRDLAHDPPSLKDLQRGAPGPLGDARTTREHLVVAATARVLLAAFLLRVEHTGYPHPFKDFATAPLLKIAARTGWALGEHDALRHLRSALTHLRHHGGDIDVPRLLVLYRQLVGPPPVREVASLDDVAARDPLAAAFPAAPGRALPETRFLTSALRYLDRPGKEDKLFAALFWQYVRLRSRLYQHLTEAPETAGLDWFDTHFSRIGALRRGLDGVLAAGALRFDARGLRLVSLEGRTAPTASWSAIRDEVRHLARHARAHNAAHSEADRTEVGLVLHFIKRAEWKSADGKRLELDPRGTGFRCGKWSTEEAKKAMAIAAALDHHPELLLVLRGIDAANRELAIPTFCLVPLFERVRSASRRASARLAVTRPRWEVPPMRATCHAGEDYRRLLQGIRRVHELVEFELIQHGDRLGHGLALAHSPKRWARGGKITVQSREERLDDLVWLLDRFGHGDISATGSEIERTRVDALDLARQIYRLPFDADALVHARRLRHAPRALARLGFPFFPSLSPPAGDPAARLLFAYLTDPAVFERGQRVIEVLADDVDLALTRAAQAFVRREIIRLEITVETNPSSNLTVGDLGDLEHHPLFRMVPLEPRAADAPLLATVNTDDPLTFATSLADELAHLRYGLERQGVDGTTALDYLDRLRAQSLRSRFTLPASARDVDVAALLAPKEAAAGRARTSTDVHGRL
jgi:hypothetical protein